MQMRHNCEIGTTAAALVCTTETTVRFSEVDAMQVVWHGEYVRYFEDGREAFGRKFPGLGYMDIYSCGYTAPVVDLQVQYLAPLTLNDVAVIETRYIDLAAAKLCFEYIIRRGRDGVSVARGRSLQVFLDREGNMALSRPEFLEEWKKKWMEK